MAQKSLRNNKGTILRVLKYMVKGYPISFIVVILCIIGSALATVQGTLFAQSLIDDYIMPLTQVANPDFAPLAWALARMVLIYGIGIVCAYAYNRIMVNISQGTMRNLRVRLFTAYGICCRFDILIPMRMATSCRCIRTMWIHYVSSSVRVYRRRFILPCRW